jgi:hypothetical protein
VGRCNPQERTRFLDAIGYVSLVTALPPTWGQEHKDAFGATTVSDRATTALKLALSTTIEGEALAALGAIKRTLSGAGNDLHDIQITVWKQRRQRAA